MALRLIRLCFGLVLEALVTGTQTDRLLRPQMPTTSQLRDPMTERPSKISIRAFDSALQHFDLMPGLEVAIGLSLSWIKAMNHFLYSC